MKEYLLAILTGLVDHPGKLSIEEISENANTRLLKISCDKYDIGKLIGKKGKMANALRTVMIAAGAKKELRILIEFPR